LGYAAITRGRPVLGALAWSVLFVKPHLAFPLLPLAFALGGRRCGFTLIAAVFAGNLLGLALSPNPLGLPTEYLRHLAGGHTLVKYNSVEFNPLLTSWNAALLAAGGPAVELGVVGTLAGYAVALAVVLARCRCGGADGAWLLAVGTAVAPVVCQVLGYEMLLLVGVMPLVAGRWPGTLWWRLAVLAACWALKSTPIETANALAEAAGPGRLGALVMAYRSLAALGILAIVVTLPPKAR